MFRLEDTEIAKAVDRCRELHPTVRLTDTFGVYTVTGSESNKLYKVSCYRAPKGFKTIDCTCKTRDGVACKHAVAALALHIYCATVRQIMQRRAARLARSH
jgi:uncharacterized Zn finger protein